VETQDQLLELLMLYIRIILIKTEANPAIFQTPEYSQFQTANEVIVRTLTREDPLTHDLINDLFKALCQIIADR